MSIRLILSLAAFSLLTACAADPGEGKTAATVEEAPAAAEKPAAAAEKPAEAAAEEPAAAGTALAIDPSKSTLHIVGAKVTKQHEIDAREWSGEVSVDGDSVVGLNFTVQMASIEADHPKLTKHLQSGDFFDVATHPTSTFTSAEIKEEAGEGTTHSISGDLTLRGATKRITFPATLAVSADGVTCKAEFVIYRQDFGVVYPGKPDDLIKDNVALTIEIAAPRS